MQTTHAYVLLRIYSWILDVLVCNLLGMVTGMATLRYFTAAEYNWQGLSQQPSLLGMV